MEHFELIMEKLEKMDAKVTSIDLSITGDPLRGMLGMKQHVETLKTDFHDHVRTDADQFKKMDGVRSWIAGAVFVAAGVVSVVVFVVNKIL